MTIQSFKSREEAEVWMESEVNDPYQDNERFAYLDDVVMVTAYKKQQDGGCCGFFDEEIEVNGRKAMIGCNYGH